ncbi:MAG: hypothetical protein MJZ17_08200 [Bacteroidales bacterium]|nr:hypothetical protein [Bacteroidales bacterium]
MKGYDLYRDNVALLYRRFGEYRTHSRYFFSPLPFEVKYELFSGRSKRLMDIRSVRVPIPLGALFLCWEQYPDLFRVATPSGDAMIFSFNGSPLSGANSYSAVNLETGEVFQGNNAPGFLNRCKCLDSAIETVELGLEQMCERKGVPRAEFSSASIEETVEYVRALEG